MLGKLLELSIDCENVLDSLHYWQGLGFDSIPVGDVWPHKYGVMSDGRLCLGLHDYRFPSPSLTFVTPELPTRVAQLEADGIELAFSKLGPNQFNEAGFFDPSGQTVCLLEARTFSPPPFQQDSFALPGYFRALRRRSRDPEAAATFWESLGLMRSPDEDGVTEVCAEGFNLQFDQGGPEVCLVFETPELEARAAKLEYDGHNIRREKESLVIPAPDGLSLMLKALE
ncbi:hypothetical protein J2T60_002162 [Natronospira proteinivora]|uniref:VOC domain-containing protein n=1 Tax=Natronospira proteinivora TaxID=1807133 RepID=A0ABT1GA16_9GAMM|nr:hypothetical protein [Natronospira proteinivora]MCP1728162.1 hypothetical protein [Natronospira proteinivora]